MNLFERITHQRQDAEKRNIIMCSDEVICLLSKMNAHSFVCQQTYDDVFN